MNCWMKVMPCSPLSWVGCRYSRILAAGLEGHTHTIPDQVAYPGRPPRASDFVRRRAVSVNLLYGFGRFNLQNPGYPPAHFPWCEPCISHRVVRYQPHAIATMAGGFYAHRSAPLAA